MNFKVKSRIYFSLILVVFLSQSLSGQNKKDSLINLIAIEKNDSLKADLLNDLAWLIKYSDSDSALYFANQALLLSETIKNDYQKANSQSRIGVIYWIGGEYDKALSYMQSCNEYYTKVNNERGILISLSNMGLITQNQGDFSASIDFLFKALKITDKNSDSTSRATVLTNLGNTYYLMLDYEQAKKHYLESVYLKTILNYTSTLHKTQMNLGVIYQKQNNPDSALYYYDLALEKAEIIEDWKNISLSKANIATIFHERNELKKAKKFYHGALDIYESDKYENQYDEAILVSSMSAYYRTVKDYNLAQYYANRTIEIAFELNNQQLIKDAYFQISENKHATRDFEGAFEAYKNFNQYEDSLFTLDKAHQMEEIRTAYETEKKEEQIKIQSLEIQSQQATNTRNTILIIALSFSIILILIIALLLKNRLQKKQQLVIQRKDLDFKEMQISAVIDSQEKERKRFATDLHDGFGQLISILKLNVESIEQQKDQEKRHSLFEKSTNVLNDMYGELRNICFNLMPQSLVKFGLVPSLKEFADKINISEKIVVEVMTFDMDERLTDLQEISLYRITQEWVNNILKYSDAQNITIQITKDEAEVTLTIEDNGTGFEMEKLTESKGNGWKNMRSRSNLIHADLVLDTTPNIKGNMLSINMPVQHTTKEPQLSNA